MNELMNQIQPVIIELCAMVLTAIASYVGIKVKQIFQEKANTEAKKKVVESTCKYVEQIYKDLHGKEKLDKAKEAILEQLNEKGIKISDLEMTVLIEAVIKGFNDGKNSVKDVTLIEE